MDLGLGELTDDQLLDLLEQACNELATRDGYVRKFAQQTIVSGAEKAKIARDALVGAAERVKADYIRQIRSEVEQDVRAAVASGEIRLDAIEEQRAIVEASLESKIKIIDEMVGKLKAGKGDRFFCEIQGTLVTVNFGKQRLQAKSMLSPEAMEAIGVQLRNIVTGDWR